MELAITRKYLVDGTNGSLWFNGSLICHTIELPWKFNLPRISCIPEGRYQLVERHSEKYPKHLLVEGVPGRSLILFHPANYAKEQLQGCIAPVIRLVGEGMGMRSRDAFNKLLSLVIPRLQAEKAWLTIGAAESKLAVNAYGLKFA